VCPDARRPLSRKRGQRPRAQRGAAERRGVARGRPRAGLAANTGMTVEQVAACPIFLTGSAAEIRDGLEKRRERFGLSYIVIQGRDHAMVEKFASLIVAPLSGK